MEAWRVAVRPGSQVWQLKPTASAVRMVVLLRPRPDLQQSAGLGIALQTHPVACSAERRACLRSCSCAAALVRFKIWQAGGRALRAGGSSFVLCARLLCDSAGLGCHKEAGSGQDHPYCRVQCSNVRYRLPKVRRTIAPVGVRAAPSLWAHSLPHGVPGVCCTQGWSAASLANLMNEAAILTVSCVRVHS